MGKFLIQASVALAVGTMVSILTGGIGGLVAAVVAGGIVESMMG